MEIISKENAKLLNLKYYFTGKPCKHGHYAKRLVSTRTCSQCIIDYDKQLLKQRPCTIKSDGIYCPTRKMSRKEAIIFGLEFYYTGKPCKNGHVDIRKVSNRTCQQCQLDAYHQNKEKYLNIQEKRRRTQSSNIKEKDAKYYQKRKNDPIFKAQRLSEKRRNGAARNAKREAQKLKAIPLWSNSEVIQKLYEKSSKLTEKTRILHHVHHIVPLQADKTVCGLHCEDNLIVVTETEHKILHSDNNKLRSLW